MVKKCCETSLMRVSVLNLKTGTFPWEATLPFHFYFPSQKGQLLKDRICSHRSKFFLLRVDSVLEGLNCPGSETKLAEKHEGRPKKKWEDVLDLSIKCTRMCY